MKVRTRIAPSPTGYAHVGTAYTALLNHAFARKNKGNFIIRIEDSDLKRNIKGAEAKIYEALTWLGINWDEGTTKGGEFGPYKLSERLDLYKAKAHELVQKGSAYEDNGAIRFKNPGENISWDDAIRGNISFPGDQITDFVILKSDGYPTYNFSVVVDDIAMAITHVIRGEDHVSNTPRQIALYKAFDATPPVFAHHPMLLNAGKKKLSKRDAVVDIEEYKKQGYIPEAFVNFLCLMGWSHPKGKEIFDLAEFVSEFSLERVRPSGAVFDVKKLDWLNKQYLQELDENTYFTYVKAASKYPDNPRFEEIVRNSHKLVAPRISTFKEFDQMAGFYFKAPDVDTNLFGQDYKNHLNNVLNALESLTTWDQDSVDKILTGVVQNSNYHTGKFFQNLRVAITGSKVSPPINESIVAILGKEETVSRIKSALHAPEKKPH
jgi:glutamyl-tRNA synthetase